MTGVFETFPKNVSKWKLQEAFPMHVGYQALSAERDMSNSINSVFQISSSNHCNTWNITYFRKFLQVLQWTQSICWLKVLNVSASADKCCDRVQLNMFRIWAISFYLFICYLFHLLTGTTTADILSVQKAINYDLSYFEV